MIDFEVPAETKALHAKTAKFVQEFCVPAEAEIGKRPLREILKPLQAKAREAGLWTPHISKAWGGLGLSPLNNAIIQMELGKSKLAELALNTMGPDDATMLTIEAHGTEAQKQKYLVPLVNGEARISYSMTERAAGADATGLQTSAVRDGDNWVINGEKWFTSNANIANYVLLQAKTDPDAPRHERFSAFLIDLPNPAYDIIRHVPVMGRTKARDDEFGAECEIRIKDLVVPAEAMLGQRGQGFMLGQHRLGYGRLRHGMRYIGIAQRALDLAVAYATERVTFGSAVADRQGIQFMLADCASEMYLTRLMLLHIAYKMEHHLDLRQENSIAKVFIPSMVYRVVDTAIQLHGALGYTHDTPLAEEYTHIRQSRFSDGPDEVHKWIVGRNVVKAWKRDGTTAAACGGDLF